MYRTIKLERSCKLLVLDHQIPYAVLAVVVFIRRDEERLLVLVFDQGFF